MIHRIIYTISLLFFFSTSTAQQPKVVKKICTPSKQSLIDSSNQSINIKIDNANYINLDKIDSLSSIKKAQLKVINSNLVTHNNHEFCLLKLLFILLLMSGLSFLINKQGVNLGLFSKEFWKKHKIIINASFISIFLLIIFFGLKECDLKLLGLDVKWLLLCGVPILLALVMGEYITKFKGFGFEFEANLNKPISTSIISKVNYIPFEKYIKGESIRLSYLSPKVRDKIDVLTFDIKKEKNYYGIDAIIEHFKYLKNLLYIEITENEKFKYLLLASIFKNSDNYSTDNIINREEVRKLISAIEKNDIKYYFPNAVNEYILLSDSNISAYRKINNSLQSDELSDGFNAKKLPVLNDEKLIGIANLQKIIDSIMEEVDKSIA